ncbi:MAG: hypothetical protein RI897_1874 [Verrucomicrobiota bacterium]
MASRVLRNGRDLFCVGWGRGVWCLRGVFCFVPWRVAAECVAYEI